MRCSFVHFGDVHLGTQQYDSAERLNDFGRAWLFACQYAVEHRPDFVICSGDLFNRFTINPLTFDQAYGGLAMLRDAGIPIVDVQGNHDRVRNGEGKCWLDSLAERGMLTHLDLETAADGLRLKPVGTSRFTGSYVEWANCRIVGVRYLGTSTERVLAMLRDALAPLPRDGLFTILVLHAGLEGIVPHFNAELSAAALEQLHEFVDYVALGHIHKHYAVGNFAFNGGSLETWALNEWEWERGLLHVEVDTARERVVNARLIDVPKRPFCRIRFDVSEFDDPRSLLRAGWEMLEREERKRPSQDPVVTFELTGRLRFHQGDLPINKLEDACREMLRPLVLRVLERYDLNAYETEREDDEAEPIDRSVLEKQILQARLAEDARFAPHAEKLARLALTLKERALQNENGPQLVETFREGWQKIQESRDQVTIGDNVKES
ncbi:MAG TPA: exonuclease SbcCD subunit D [Chloroflexota bacterium]|nr:exonuclease SbcCD subunit D [Chloroflexota bacterium]